MRAWPSSPPPLIRRCNQNDNKAARRRQRRRTFQYAEEPTLSPTQLAFDCDFLLPLQPGVECIPDPLTQKVVGKDRDKDCQTGEQRQPPGKLDVVLSRGKDIAPAWRW